MMLCQYLKNKRSRAELLRGNSAYALREFSASHWDAEALAWVTGNLDQFWKSLKTNGMRMAFPKVLVQAILQQNSSVDTSKLWEWMIWNKDYEADPDFIQQLMDIAPLLFTARTIPSTWWSSDYIEKAWQQIPEAIAKDLPLSAVTPERLAWMKANPVASWTTLCQKDVGVPLQELLELIQDKREHFKIDYYDKTTLGERLSSQLIARCQTKEDLHAVFTLLYEWKLIPITRLPTWMITKDMLKGYMEAYMFRDPWLSCCCNQDPDEHLERLFDACNETKTSEYETEGEFLLWIPDDARHQRQCLPLGPTHHALLMKHFTLQDLRRMALRNRHLLFLYRRETRAKVLGL